MENANRSRDGRSEAGRIAVILAAAAIAPAAIAAPRPEDPRVVAAAARLERLAEALRDAAQDDRVTAEETARARDLARKALDRSLDLVASQGAPAVFATERALAQAKDGKLVPSKAEAAAALVEAGRKAMLEVARRHRFSNLFRRLGRGWSAPYHGVRTKDMSFEGRPAHAVAIDLSNPRVRLQTNGPASRGRAVERQARDHRSEIAINGDFFTWSTYRPSGPARHAGRDWGGKGEPMLAFRGGHADIVRGGSGPEWATGIVSGRPLVLAHGEVTTDYTHNGERARRTGVGVSEDGRALYLVAGPNLSGRQLGRLLKSLGAHEGIAMDAGGSAQMYQSHRGMVQASSDPGGARAVANAILVQAVGR